MRAVGRSIKAALLLEENSNKEQKKSKEKIV